jgi:hypothetical protein
MLYVADRESELFTKLNRKGVGKTLVFPIRGNIKTDGF